MAEAVVGDVGRVLYYSVFESGFPHPKNFLPGYGVEGIQRIGPGESIEDFFDAVEIADLVVFTDVGHYGLQEYLKRQGVPVFGSGRSGRLEQDRLYLKSVAGKLGMDVADYTSIRGIDNLRDFLLGGGDAAPIPECYIKLSFWRGLAETFHHTSLFITRSWLDELSIEAGPYAQEIEFLIEQPIDDEPCVEVGIDCPWSADGMFPERLMWGYEASKDNCYVGRAGALPQRLREFADALAPELGERGYRGPLCTETRECPDKSYFIDFTGRFGEPPSSLQRFMIDNWAEGMWEAANGRIVEAEFNAPIGVQILWKSGYGKDHPLAVKVGRQDRVTIHGHFVIDGQDYAVSPAEIEEAGGACGMGSSLEEAVGDALDAIQSIEGREVTYDTGFMDKISEAIEKGLQLGLRWSSGYVEASA